MMIKFKRMEEIKNKYPFYVVIFKMGGYARVIQNDVYIVCNRFDTTVKQIDNSLIMSSFSINKVKHMVGKMAFDKISNLTVDIEKGFEIDLINDLEDSNKYEEEVKNGKFRLKYKKSFREIEMRK